MTFKTNCIARVYISIEASSIAKETVTYPVMPRSKSKMKKNTSPTASENKLIRLRDKMNEMKVRYPRNNEWLNQFAISTKDIEKTCMSFSVAYNEAKRTTCTMMFCSYAASMICSVSPGLSISVHAALDAAVEEFGLTRPNKVSISPSSSEANKVPLMNWSTIVVYFACCIYLLFKDTDSGSYYTLMASCVRELSDVAGCDPNAKLDIPFRYWKGWGITAMLGASSNVRGDAIRFLVSNVENEDEAIRGVCKYLCDKLSWSGMRHFALMNKFFVEPQSPFLLDRPVKKEVDNLFEAYEAIASHVCPQFYMYLASDLELLKVQPSRFSSLVYVAEVAEQRASSIQEMSGGTSVGP